MNITLEDGLYVASDQLPIVGIVSVQGASETDCRLKMWVLNHALETAMSESHKLPPIDEWSGAEMAGALQLFKKITEGKS